MKIQKVYLLLPIPNLRGYHPRTDTVPDCNSLQMIPLTNGFLETLAHNMKELKKPAMTSQRYYRQFFCMNTLTHAHVPTYMYTL